MEATETVLSSSPEEVRVQVQLRRPGSPDRTFVVRFDRAAQLSGVEMVDGLPPAVLGQSAFPEFLPAAATAPPKKMLAPGRSGRSTSSPPCRAASPPTSRARASWCGSPVREARRRRRCGPRPGCPWSAPASWASVTVALEGVEVTEATSTRSLSDGAIHDATSITKGTFQLTLTGPGDNALPVTGTSSVEVRSETRRLPPEKEEAASPGG